MAECDDSVRRVICVTFRNSSSGYLYEAFTWKNKSSFRFFLFSSDATVSIFLNYLNGSFLLRNVFSIQGFNPRAIVLSYRLQSRQSNGDFNGDRRLNLTITEFYVNALAVYLSISNGSFSSHITVPTDLFSSKIVLGRFNGDSRSDIATVLNGNASVGFFGTSANR
jgi:hypothetical protein